MYPKYFQIPQILSSEDYFSGVAPLGKLAAFWDVPVHCYLANGVELANKKIFPTLSRVSLTQQELAKVIFL